MPNGIDKTLQRLIRACAAYRAKYEEWPAEAWMEAGYIFDLAQLLDHENFTLLATRIRLRTKDAGISVGGAKGVYVYGDIELDDRAIALIETADRWLGVELRRDLEGY